MHRSYTPFLALLLVLATALAQADFTGPVVAVTTGDTIKVLRDGKEVKVRLHGIDAPERRQPFGNRAKQYASELTLGETVTVLEKDPDRHGRVVGVVFLPDGRNLNHEMVRAGLAWWYARYAPDDEDLPRLQEEARQDTRGVWSEPAPETPWEWRKQRGRKRTSTYNR